jgi:hypothetical protein
MLPVMLFTVPATTPLPGNIRSIDLVGLGLFSLAFACFDIYVAFGGNVLPWSGGGMIALIVIAGIGIVIFAVQQYFCILTSAASRAFPVNMLASWQMWVLFVEAVCALGSINMTLYFLPLFFQFTRGVSARSAGVLMLPAICATVVGLVLCGVGMKVYLWYKAWYVVGASLALTGSILLHRLSTETSQAYVLGSSVLVGFGGGLFAQASLVVAQSTVLEEEIASATTLIILAQIAGPSLCLAISNNIFLNCAVRNIAKAFPLLDSAEIRHLIASTQAAASEFSPAEVNQARAMIVDALRDVFVAIIAAASLALLLATVMKKERLKVR